MAFNRTTVTFLDGNGVPLTAIAYNDGSNYSMPHPLLDSTGAIINAATSDLQTAGNISLASIATSAALLSTSALQTTGNNILTSIATLLAGTITIAGAVTVGSSALPTGAATSALQTTGNTSLAAIATSVAAGATAVNQATANTSLATLITQTAGLATSAKQDTAQITLAAIAASVAAATPAGSAIIGKVGFDQTTPGTTNGVQVNAALPAGSATIGAVNAAANTSGGTATFNAAGSPSNALLTNSGVSVKSSAGNLYGVNFVNTGTADAYVQVFDNASPTLGATAPKLVFFVAAGGSWEEKFTGEAKISFSNAIVVAATTGPVNNTAPATGILANIIYK